MRDNVEDRLYHWRLTSDSIYGSSRGKTQLLYGGIALAFAAERARFGGDSYALLEATGGDFDAFAAGYRLRGLLQSILGQLLLRGLRDSRVAHRYFADAVRSGHVGPRVLLLWAWTSLGFPWIGRKPLRPPQREFDAGPGGKS